MFNSHASAADRETVPSCPKLTATPAVSAPTVTDSCEYVESSEGQGAATCLRTEGPLVPLGLLSCREKAVIVAMQSGKHACGSACFRQQALSRLEDLGLRQGKTIEVLNNPGCGLILVRVDEARIALGRGAAMKIMVRRVRP